MPHTSSILFVDDDADNRFTLGWLFRRAGFEVREAGNGEDALRLVRDRPDLVVLDVNLPDISGFEVCRRIKEHPATRSIPVLHLSAVYVGSGDRSQGLEAGADGYLIKPVEPRELLATVRALLRVHEAEEALRAAAQEWRTTFDALSDAVCLVDARGIIRRCNRALSELLRRPFDDLVDRPYAVALQEGLGLAEPPSLELVGEESEPGPREMRLGARWYRVTANPITDARGGRTGTVHILTDITSRKELEEQLRQGQKLEAIGRLAGGVAHDFNNLLTAILGNAALLGQRLPAAEPAHELVATIEHAAWRAAELTRQLLGFSRQTLLWLRPTNLNDSVTEVVGLLQRTIDPRITPEVRLVPGLWPVQADPGQVSQVLMNLCLNACDAMPEGGRLTLETGNEIVGGEGEVRRHADARPGRFARLSVSDTGHGIAPDVLPRIFDPFFTTKPPGKGTGLGLAMVFGIVKQHEGWVECRSEVGRGTRFDIFLPRLEAPPSTAAAVTPPTLARGGHETILLADDNDMLRQLGATLLRKYGFEVLLAEDGRAAVELFRREHARIHLVILDLRMPRLSGQDALREMRSFAPHVAALFASGHADVPAENLEQPGVFGFLAKPYRERDLIHAVRGALDRARPKPV